MHLHRSIIALLMTCSLSAVTQLSAEIIKVTVQWERPACRESCNIELAQALSAIKEVKDVNYDANAATADLIWRPNAPFNLDALTMAMHRLGIGYLSFNVKARGVIVHDRYNITLQSLGDNTRFMLLGPIKQDPIRYVEEWNVETHKLDPLMKARLLEVEKNDQIVTIEGPLFDLERPPLKLIVTSMTVEKGRVAD